MPSAAGAPGEAPPKAQEPEPAKAAENGDGGKKSVTPDTKVDAKIESELEAKAEAKAEPAPAESEPKLEVPEAGKQISPAEEAPEKAPGVGETKVEVQAKGSEAGAEKAPETESKSEETPQSAQERKPENTAAQAAPPANAVRLPFEFSILFKLYRSNQGESLRQHSSFWDVLLSLA